MNKNLSAFSCFQKRNVLLLYHGLLSEATAIKREKDMTQKLFQKTRKNRIEYSLSNSIKTW